MPTRKAPSTSVYELKITLREILPPIWRRVRVPAKVRLSCLHDVFQIVMGWTDSHLHQFEKDGAHYGVPDEEDVVEMIDAGRVSLATLLEAEGDSLVYTYDFGDGWRHDVVLEKILGWSDKATRPECVGGDRHCPPEDVGGPRGYEQFLEVIFDPTHEDHVNMVRWAGGRFHAEDFDLKDVNLSLARMRWPVRCYK